MRRREFMAGWRRSAWRWRLAQQRAYRWLESCSWLAGAAVRNLQASAKA